MNLLVVVTDRDLTVLDSLSQRTETRPGWIALDATLRFNAPDSGSVVVPLTPDNALLFAPGNRIEIIRNGEWFVGGPIERPGEHDWDLNGQKTLTVGFTSDLALIFGRLAYPDPANAITAQTSSRYEFAAVNAEDALQQLVDDNAGPAALADRQVPQLVIASDAGVGSNITLGFRLDKLGDALRAIATAGGQLGFRTARVGDTIEFQVYEPQDLTAQVVYSVGFRNLLGYKYRPEAPRATVAIVGDGTGTGTSRVFRERISADATSWWRLETLVDARDTTDTAELDASGDNELIEQGARFTLTARCKDTPGQVYGQHVRLGDLVTVELATGDLVADIVSSVRLEASPPTGEVLTMQIGTQAANTTSQWLALVRKLQRDVQRLQAI